MTARATLAELAAEQQVSKTWLGRLLRQLFYAGRTDLAYELRDGRAFYPREAVLKAVESLPHHQAAAKAAWLAVGQYEAASARVARQPRRRAPAPRAQASEPEVYVVRRRAAS